MAANTDKTFSNYNDRAKFYYEVFNLLKLAAEALVASNTIRDIYNLNPLDETLNRNDELLRMLFFSTRQSCIIALYIVTDNDGQGSKGYNIHRLLYKSSQIHLTRHDVFNATHLTIKLAKSKPIIEKISRVRNNAKAHLAENKTWINSKIFATGFSMKEVAVLVANLFDIMNECGAAFGLRQFSFDKIETQMRTQVERMVEGLKLENAARRAAESKQGKGIKS